MTINCLQFSPNLVKTTLVWRRTTDNDAEVRSDIQFSVGVFKHAVQWENKVAIVIKYVITFMVYKYLCNVFPRTKANKVQPSRDTERNSIQVSSESIRLRMHELALTRLLRCCIGSFYCVKKMASIQLSYNTKSPNSETKIAIAITHWRDRSGRKTISSWPATG